MATFYRPRYPKGMTGHEDRRLWREHLDGVCQRYGIEDRRPFDDLLTRKAQNHLEVRAHDEAIGKERDPKRRLVLQNIRRTVIAQGLLIERMIAAVITPRENGDGTGGDPLAAVRAAVARANKAERPRTPAARTKRLEA